MLHNCNCKQASFWLDIVEAVKERCVKLWCKEEEVEEGILIASSSRRKKYEGCE
jgi:hypothetical protein